MSTVISNQLQRTGGGLWDWLLPSEPQICQILINSLPNRSCHTLFRWQSKRRSQAQVPGFPVGKSVGWSLDHCRECALEWLPLGLISDSTLLGLGWWISDTKFFNTHSAFALTQKFQHVALEGQLCPGFSVAHCSSHIHQDSSSLVLLHLGLFGLHGNWVSQPLLPSKVW